MSAISKERAELKAFITGFLSDPAHDDKTLNSLTAEVFRIALASLEAEPVGFIARHKETGKFGSYLHPKADWFKNDDYEVMSAYTATPTPVSVPDELAGKSFNYIANKCQVSTSEAQWILVGWNARSAAMLQGAEPVTTANKLLDDFDFDRFNDVVWLEAVASNPHMHSPTTTTIAMVALELNRKLADCNSPVIPDGWVMVPKEPTSEMLNAAWVSHGVYHPSAYRTMLAAAPQQEVKP